MAESSPSADRPPDAVIEIAPAAISANQAETPAVMPVEVVSFSPPAAPIELRFDDATEVDAFFARADVGHSFPPTASDASVEEEVLLPVHSPALSDRRARLRKIVTGVVGAASLLSLFVLVKSVASRGESHAEIDRSLTRLGPVVASIDLGAVSSGSTIDPAPSATAPTTPATESVLAPPVAAAPAVADPAAAQRPAVAEHAMVGAADRAEQPMVAARIEASSEPARSPAPAVVASPAARARSPATKTEARRLIGQGKLRDGIAMARAVLAADPGDAETYLLLGAALQDNGQWNESALAFASCVQQARRGPIDECRALQR